MFFWPLTLSCPSTCALQSCRWIPWLSSLTEPNGFRPFMKCSVYLTFLNSLAHYSTVLACGVSLEKYSAFLERFVCHSSSLNPSYNRKITSEYWKPYIFTTWRQSHRVAPSRLHIKYPSWGLSRLLPELVVSDLWTQKLRPEVMIYVIKLKIEQPKMYGQKSHHELHLALTIWSFAFQLFADLHLCQSHPPPPPISLLSLLCLPMTPIKYLFSD